MPMHMGKQTDAVLVLLSKENETLLMCYCFIPHINLLEEEPSILGCFRLFFSEVVVNELLVMETKYLHGSYV